MKRTLTEGAGHYLSLLPGRFHRSSHSEEVSDLQLAALVVGFSEFPQLGSWVQAPLKTVTTVPTCWRSENKMQTLSNLNKNRNLEKPPSSNVNVRMIGSRKTQTEVLEQSNSHVSPSLSSLLFQHMQFITPVPSSTVSTGVSLR